VITLPPLFILQRILPQLQAGELVLTPNNRLRSKILQAWGDYQQAQGHKVWQAPKVEVIDQWFLKQWGDLQAQSYEKSLKVIASHNQLRVLWEKITANCGLMQTTAIAKQAASAFRTLELWGFSTEDLRRDYHDASSAQLTQWAQQFQQQLNTSGFITAEESYAIIGSAFETQQLTKEPAIYLLGFDDVAPLVERQLQKASDSIIYLPPSNHQPSLLSRTEFDNTDDEMNAAAQWARNLLEHSLENGNNSNSSSTMPRIGIIVPNLGQSRKKIEHAFTAEFEAHNFCSHTERYTLPFNFSAGTPLGDTPLITSALQCLKLQQQEWDVGVIVQLLLSPFWGRYQEELEQRCALADRLQSLGLFTISGDQLRYWAQRIDEKNYSSSNQSEKLTTKIFDYLNQFNQHCTTPINKGKHLPSQWVDIFLQQLDILEWPGERTPDSQEYQQTQMWHQLLESFTHLDKVLGAISSFDALQELQQISSKGA